MCGETNKRRGPPQSSRFSTGGTRPSAKARHQAQASAVHIDLEVQAGSRGGVFTRGEAIAAGYTDADIKQLVRRGDWRRIRWGRFVTAAVWDQADELGRLAMRCHACVASGRACRVSHDTSARLQQLPVVLPGGAPTDDLLHLTVPTPPGSRPRVGTRVHVASVPAEHCREVRGLTVTSPLRTAFDLARLHGELTGVIAADAALSMGEDPIELTSLVDGLAHWPGAAAARRMPALVDAGAQSPGETISRLLLRSLGLGVVETQVRFEGGGWNTTVDLVVGRLIVEFDGRVKYGRDRRFGQDRTPEQLLWEEKQREDWLRSLGYVVVRLTWADLWPPRREATLRMLAEKFWLAQRTFV